MTETTRLRALLAEATKGPWNINRIDEDGECVRAGGTHIATCDLHFHDDIKPIDQANAALIAEAINALPALLDAADELERVKGENARLRAQLDTAKPIGWGEPSTSFGAGPTTVPKGGW